ncbi:MAG TPA: hypothetical protein EYH30_03520 [Anaerolineales bacterium]|nr:hypothetical protein [Anaerolineales bacterium]
MDIGLLWFDNDPRRGLEEKVLRAVAHYRRKYGHTPNVCFVHPSMLNGNGRRSVLRAGGVEVRPGRAILPDHFWVGTAEDQ